MDTQIFFLNALNHITTLTPKTLFTLMERFEYDAKRLWEAPFSELSFTGLQPQTGEKLNEERGKINPEKAWNDLQKHHIEIMAHPALINNETPKTQYPELLVQIAEPPPVLYYKGTLEFERHPRLAVVGSRKCTHYGKRVTEDIIETIALHDIVIVSGLAIGIDSYAHLAALKARKPTVAVLANGLDRIYPSMNTKIVQEILEHNGTLLSEFPPGIPPERYHFPRRNRIISGLAQATLVVEANLKSGSLITAYRALHQNRDVFAIPGNIYSPQSEGTNTLIKEGAKIIRRAEDILEEYGIALMPKQAEKTVFINKESATHSSIEQKIYDVLSLDMPIHIDDIIKKTAHAPREVNAALTMMELAGRIENVGGGQYICL